MSQKTRKSMIQGKTTGSTTPIDRIRGSYTKHKKAYNRTALFSVLGIVALFVIFGLASLLGSIGDIGNVEHREARVRVNDLLRGSDVSQIFSVKAYVLNPNATEINSSVLYLYDQWMIGNGKDAGDVILPFDILFNSINVSGYWINLQTTSTVYPQYNDFWIVLNRYTLDASGYQNVYVCSEPSTKSVTFKYLNGTVAPSLNGSIATQYDMIINLSNETTAAMNMNMKMSGGKLAVLYPCVNVTFNSSLVIGSVNITSYVHFNTNPLFGCGSCANVARVIDPSNNTKMQFLTTFLRGYNDLRISIASNISSVSKSIGYTYQIAS